MREKLQNQVLWHRDGSRLDIFSDTDVDDLFGNPCRGVFKVGRSLDCRRGVWRSLRALADAVLQCLQVLILRYSTVDTKGVYKIHVPGPGTPLGQNLRIGWMPGT